MRGAVNLWMVGAAFVSLIYSAIYSVQVIHAAEIKRPIQIASSDTGSTRIPFGYPKYVGEQIARDSDRNLSFDVASPGALRNKYTAIRRVCRALSQETRDILLSCR